MNEHLVVTPYKMSDYKDLLQIQKEAFPPPFPEELWWSKAHINAHVNTFAEGALLAKLNGEPAGSATSLITTYDGSPHTWEEISDNGYIQSSHKPNGDTLYGIDLCVRPAFRGKGVAKALYDARKQLVTQLGLTRYVAGCRIPGYHRYSNTLDVESYVNNVEQGLIHDLVLTFMLRQGLKPLQILPHYVEDEESKNYAVLVEWKNPALT
ncbi:GNAT family N-acetyltransferase [Salipaludibacillus agaradhaerens]|uniref:GNAT family N-acetyltransferase n=1 Tax=Salipaludibacillus agaradhaerens TaxID=76935 RepID=A0A9Q4B5A6_SALAG|nr:GNAT family N-acetyltransferase [Salipaludibacillus agaradhaerens]MCR6098621.1 GNAT family N-acetyltransferase [Salipaludibacillus agaradhaerens]MCR6115628.1 GNAT family N-acetyltransferase [Salipaludibacillus agaradhaerens]